MAKQVTLLMVIVVLCFKSFHKTYGFLQQFEKEVISNEPKFFDKIKPKREPIYQPTWDSLDKRPLPTWYDEAKFGIFIHWGVFSVPSYGSEWFWEYWKGEKKRQSIIDYMKKNYPPNFTYQDFAKSFSAELFDPLQWAQLIKESGARYVVLTTKHHEGFTNWPSPVSWNWNAMDVGPNRNLVADFVSAIRNSTDLHLGLYHSLFEWFNPMYLSDVKAKFTTRSFPEKKTIPELYELINTFKPEILWSDGPHGPSDYWNSTGFLAWLYNESPVKDKVVTNDRWGSDTKCKHGGYYTCNDRYNPGVLQKHKWEDCMTIDKHSWGYRREANIEDFLTIEEIIATLASTISCGGNMLMNIGPRSDGTVAPIFQERLQQIGAWLKVNGEAVYGSKPWRAQNDTVTEKIWYTAKDSSFYAFVLSWPKDNLLVLGAPKYGGSDASITLLGSDATIVWRFEGGRVQITFPVLNPLQMPCQWSWILRFDGFK